MQINEFKKYRPILSVAICGILSIASIAYFAFMYMSLQIKDKKTSPEVIEIRLPVMNWSQYSILSKKIEGDTVSRDK